MADIDYNNTNLVVNTIIGLLQDSSDNEISTELQKKINDWVNEIANTKSWWVKTRDTILIVTCSWGAFKVQGKIRDALSKLTK